MKKKVLAIILAFGMLTSSCWQTGVAKAEGTEQPGVGETEQPGAGEAEQPEQTEGPTEEPTEEPTAPAEKTITEIEVVDTESRITYKSIFTKENIWVQITYSDGTTEKVHPDKDIELDTSMVGRQTIIVEYQEHQIEYTIEIVPRQVQGLNVKSTDKTSATIQWESLEEAKAYEIYTSAKEDGTYTLLKSVTDTSYELTNLTRGKIIYVKIRATAEDTAGEYSDAIMVAPKPDAVLGIIATKNVKTKITLTWEKAEGATGYLIYYRLVGSNDYILAGNTTELSFQVTGLKAGSDYYFQVYAYAGEMTNVSDPSPEVLYGTAPSIPSITKIKGGDKRIRVYWNKGSGADSFTVYYSTKEASGYKVWAAVPTNESKVRGIDGLKKKKKYYVKIEAVRTVSGITMKSTSTVSSATTASAKAKKTSTAAKLFTTLKKFKKSKAYKVYKAFKKRVLYSLSIIIPGLKMTNVAGFNTTGMVPQSVTFAGDYMLISAYDISKKQDSVIYVVNKSTRKYITTIVLPHNGHVGGIAFDGVNVWMTYGTKLQAFKFTEVQAAVSSGKAYYELYRISSVCQMPETVSYVAYYKDKIWAGAYNETAKKYMYGYTILNKEAAPTLTNTNRMLMPNRTQGVAFTSKGKMIVSRSCQTKKGRRGFMSRLDTYQPTWDLTKYAVKKNSLKKKVKIPPMNEGIAISGSYTYVIYESPAFAECKAPLDRVTAFKTNKIS